MVMVDLNGNVMTFDDLSNGIRYYDEVANYSKGRDKIGATVAAKKLREGVKNVTVNMNDIRKEEFVLYNHTVLAGPGVKVFDTKSARDF